MFFKPSMIFEVTDFCNLNCSFCYESGRRKKQFVTPSVFEKVIKQYKPLYLQLTGGEITTHPQFEQIISIAVNNTVKVQISTNGILSQKIIKILEKIPEKKRPFLSISLDIPDSRYDLLRNHKGLFENLCKSLQEYRKHNISFGFSATVFDEGKLKNFPEGTINDVPALIKFAESVKAPINIQPCMPADIEMRKKLGEILLKSTSGYLVNSIPFRKLLLNGHNGKCRYSWTNISIGSDGRVLPTKKDDCYFCDDCLKCFYSCVWEPTLLTSRHFFTCAKSLMTIGKTVM